MDYRIRKLYPILASALILLITGYAVLVVCYFPHKEQTYQEVIEKANAFLPNQSGSGCQAKQDRQGVQRDIWYQKEGDSRLQISLNSEISELSFEKYGNTNEIIESMQGFKGFIQEELFYDEEVKPMQHVRYIEAETAVYNYRTHVLIAERAKMICYSASGHDLIPSLEGVEPTVTAVAQSLEISILEKEFLVKANQLRTIIEQ